MTERRDAITGREYLVRPAYRIYDKISNGCAPRTTNVETITEQSFCL